MKLLLRLYPRRFRDRYGREVLDHVRASDSKLRDAADLAVSGVLLRYDDLSKRLGRTGAVFAYALSLALIVVLATGAIFDDCVVMGSAFAAWTGALTARAVGEQVAWRPAR